MDVFHRISVYVISYGHQISFISCPIRRHLAPAVALFLQEIAYYALFRLWENDIFKGCIDAAESHEIIEGKCGRDGDVIDEVLTAPPGNYLDIFCLRGPSGHIGEDRFSGAESYPDKEGWQKTMSVNEADLEWELPVGVGFPKHAELN